MLPTSRLFDEVVTTAKEANQEIDQLLQVIDQAVPTEKAAAEHRYLASKAVCTSFGADFDTLLVEKQAMTDLLQDFIQRESLKQAGLLSDEQSADYELDKEAAVAAFASKGWNAFKSTLGGLGVRLGVAKGPAMPSSGMLPSNPASLARPMTGPGAFPRTTPAPAPNPAALKRTAALPTAQTQAATKANINKLPASKPVAAPSISMAPKAAPLGPPPAPVQPANAPPSAPVSSPTPQAPAQGFAQKAMGQAQAFGNRVQQTVSQASPLQVAGGLGAGALAAGGLGYAAGQGSQQKVASFIKRWMQQAAERVTPATEVAADSATHVVHQGRAIPRDAKLVGIPGLRPRSNPKWMEFGAGAATGAMGTGLGVSAINAAQPKE